MKKIFSVITSVALTLGILSSSVIVGAAQYPQSSTPAQGSQEPGISSNMGDISLESTNSFGKLLNSTIDKKVDEQQKNNGCNIFSVEMSENKAKVDFETICDCTLVVGIYNEDANQLLASGSTKVLKDNKLAKVTIQGNDMPTYFYIKAYLIDTETFKPLCTVYESPNYTKEMQEFFAKTTDDFDKNKVVNFDEDTTNNFAVYNNDIKLIDNNEKNFIKSIDEESKKYVIENIDNSVKTLRKGNIFSLNYDKSDALIVKVSNIKISGSTATITGEDLEADEVYDYVKIDEVSNSSNIVLEESYMDTTLEDSSNRNRKSSRSITNSHNEKIKLNSILSLSLGKNYIINGKLKLEVDFKLSFYLSLNYKFFELKTDYKADITASVMSKGQLETDEKDDTDTKCPIARLTIYTPSGFIVKFSPNIIARASMVVDAQVTITGTIGFNAGTDGFNNLTTSPNINTVAKATGSLYLGVEFNPEISYLNLANGKIVANIGASVSAEMSNQKKNLTSEAIHECNNCINGKVEFIGTLAIEFNLLNIDALTLRWILNEWRKPIGNFYFSLDNLEFGFGKCPHYKYIATINVIDEDQKPVSDADVMIDNQNYKTNSFGTVKCHLDPIYHQVIIARVGYERFVSGMDINKRANNLYFCIKKPKQTGDNPGGNSGGGGIVGGGSGSDDIDTSNLISINVDSPIVSTSTGANHTGALTANGDLYTWGCNSYGQLGNGTTTDCFTPTKVMENVKSISFYDDKSAAITNDGKLFLWGRSVPCSGEFLNINFPVSIIDDVSSVINGGSYYITNDNDLYGWYNKEPNFILDNVKAFYNNGNSYYAAIRTNGDLYTWGRNFSCQTGYKGNLNISAGMLGNGTTEDSDTPQYIMSNVAYIANSCAITMNGDFYVWGGNETVYNSYDVPYNPDYFFYNMENRAEYENRRFDYPEYLSPRLIANNMDRFADNSYSVIITKSGDLCYLYGSQSDGYEYMDFHYISPNENVVSASTNVEHISFATASGDLYMGGHIPGVNGKIEEPVKIINYDYSSKNSYKAKALKMQNTVSSTVQSSKTLENESNIKTKTYKNLIPNKLYNFYVIRSKKYSNPYATPFNYYNLPYISQGTSDSDGNLSFTYVSDIPDDNVDVFVVSMSQQTDISEAKITIDNLIVNGFEQYPKPTVTYNGDTLILDKDYQISGDTSVKNVGKYTITIEGINNYRGTEKIEFQVLYNDNLEPLKNLSTISSKSIFKEEKVTFTGKANGGANPYQYRFAAKHSTDSKYTILKDYNDEATTKIWKPRKTGTYTLLVRVKDKAGKISSKKYTLTVETAPLTNNSTISADSIIKGDKVTFTGKASGGTSSYQYRFAAKHSTDSKYTILKDYKSTATSFVWKPRKTGTYTLLVRAKDKEGKIASKTYTLTVKAVPLANNSTISADSIIKGDKVTFTGKASGGTSSYLYRFAAKHSTDSKYTILKDYKSTATSFVWKPRKTGAYTLLVRVKDKEGKIASKTYTLTVKTAPLMNDSAISADSIIKGDKVTFTGKASGGTSPYKYRFAAKHSTGSEYIILKDYKSTATSFVWKPTKTGTYTLLVRVKDKEGKIASKTYALTVK